MGLFEDEMDRLREVQKSCSSIGLIPTMMKQKIHTVTYDPNKPFTIKDMEKWMKDLMEYEDKLREHRKKTGWKPEYILSMSEAKHMPLEWLEFLSNQYNVLCGLEVMNVVRERERLAEKDVKRTEP